MITSNAIHVASWVQGGPLHFIHVFALASPAVLWPGGASLHFFTNADDPVPLATVGLSLYRDEEWTRLSDADPDFIVPDLTMDAHGVEQYIYQRDFIGAIRKVLGLSGALPAAWQAPLGARPGGARRYVIKTGDTLSGIARRLYGDPKLASKIYDANRAALGKNPNLVLPGQVLVIP